jgi:hypothetical protein
VKSLPVRQLGVFLDNKPGSMSELIAHLDEAEIKIFALSIAEAGEFGLVRMIVDDPERAARILEEADFNLAKSKKNIEVIAVLIRKEDRISKVTRILGNNSINIDYAYSSAVYADGKFVLILKVGDSENTERILRESNIITLTLDEIKHHFQ